MEYKNNWKNKNVFLSQLELNKKQLKQNYPEHWMIFLKYVSEIKPDNILDVGCGCGIFYKLLNLHYPTIKYTGIDYSKDAIEIAKRQWEYQDFYEKDLWELNKIWINQFNLLYLGALLDILPNGDEALDFILSLEPKNILIGRMEITDENSGVKEEYMAYDLIKTYKYKHNWDNILNIVKTYNYEYSFYRNTLYLKSK
jgi:trans-aconitate methyltransferase